MRPIYLIARNVVRESLRRRILYVLVMFAVLLLGTLEILARFEAELQVKMVRDFGYTILSLFGLAITILVTFDQLPQEMESKTIYLVLSRPMARRTLLLGKFTGIVAVMAGLLGLLALILVLMTAVLAREQKILLDAQLFQAVYLLGLKNAVFASLLIVLTLAFTRPVAISLGLLIHFFSHVGEAAELALVQSNVKLVGWFFWVLQLGLPNYTMFDVSGAMVSQEIYSVQALAVVTAYGASFVVLYLLLATWLFATKDL